VDLAFGVDGPLAKMLVDEDDRVHASGLGKRRVRSCCVSAVASS
jgi:hypothetical protein